MRCFVLAALTAMSLTGVVSATANSATVSQPQTTYHPGQSGNTGFSPGFNPQQGDGGWG